jgi:ATP-binding cassette, subfamily A (ABC1), member 3
VFICLLTDAVGLLVTLGFLYPAAAMISFICSEKESRQKELMKMMSVTESDIAWSWFASFFVLHIVTLCCILGVSGALYENADSIYLFVFWLFGIFAVINFSMLLATLTTKATRGVVVGLLILLLGAILPVVVGFENGSSTWISLVSYHPLSAIVYGLQVAGQLEDRGVGLQSSTASETDNPSGLTFSMCMGFLIRDCITWGELSWYASRVIPPEYGQALPFYFPFTVSYWCPGRGSNSAPRDTSFGESSENDMEVPTEPAGESQRRQTALGESIEIRKLRKEFGKNVAVDDLSLSIFKGTSRTSLSPHPQSFGWSSNMFNPNLNVLDEITALLGPNGAGKSSTIAMLTGAYAPTSGTAIVCGRDVVTQMPSIRENIGVCLQHDCLFPELTVREHVQFFSRLKGLYKQMSWEEAENAIDQIIKDVALFEKRHTLSRHLSGGMKRKLSVAIAFCGNSTVVLLDEPTSGMDPFSRRFTWNVIREYRHNRCVILTTHFMDEADVLADRIAIMGEGRLRCVGSSLFLKKLYGVGYQLTIVKQLVEDQESKHGGVTNSNEDNEIDRRLCEIVEGNVHHARMLTNVGAEMTFQLPLNEAALFPPMFDGLDNEMEKGTVSTYGVGITTLEEVFLLAARGVGVPETRTSVRSDGDSFPFGEDAGASRSFRARADLKWSKLVFYHIRALFKKRAASFRRDKKAWCCTTILPSVFVLLGFLAFNFAPSERNMETLVLSWDDYDTDIDTRAGNPLVFNAPDTVFECQPAGCSYSFGGSPIVTSVDRYHLCGHQAFTGAPNECTIVDSESVMTTLGGPDGIAPTPVISSSIVSVSALCR